METALHSSKLDPLQVCTWSGHECGQCFTGGSLESRLRRGYCPGLSASSERKLGFLWWHKKRSRGVVWVLRAWGQRRAAWAGVSQGRSNLTPYGICLFFFNLCILLLFLQVNHWKNVAYSLQHTGYPILKALTFKGITFPLLRDKKLQNRK